MPDRALRAYRDLDPAVQSFGRMIIVAMAFMVGVITTSGYQWFVTRQAVTSYGFEPLLIGELGDGGIRTGIVNGEVAVYDPAIDDGLVLIPVVAERCTDDGVLAVSEMTVAVDIGAELPSLITRDDDAALALAPGCTGPIWRNVAVEIDEAILDQAISMRLRFRVVAPGRSDVVVETESFIITTQPIEHYIVRPIPNQ